MKSIYEIYDVVDKALNAIENANYDFSNWKETIETTTFEERKVLLNKLWNLKDNAESLSSRIKNYAKDNNLNRREYELEIITSNGEVIQRHKFYTSMGRAEQGLNAMIEEFTSIYGYTITEGHVYLM